MIYIEGIKTHLPLSSDKFRNINDK